MKCSKRVKLAVVAAVLAAVFLAGSAWAGEAEVVAAITSVGLSRASAESGNTITVEGNVPNATFTGVNDGSYWLDLGDISGLTINWKAQVTGDFSNLTSDANFELVRMTGSGTFNIETGAELKVPGTTNNISSVFLVRAKRDIPGMTINVNGGALEALMPNATAIDWDGGDDLSTPATIVNINGGTINVPKGMAAVGDVTVNAGTGLTGMVINLHDLKFKLYGNCTLRTTMSDDNGNPMIIGGILWETDSKATVELESGVSWIIHDSWTFTNYGTLNIYGHVTNKEKIINHGIINNYSGNSLENQGMIDNRGTINIKSTGKTINTGTIDNTSGTINNEGGTFQSVQTASEMGGTVSGEVQPLNSNTSYSGDGCNAGLGVAGLLLAGFAALKQRKE